MTGLLRFVGILNVALWLGAAVFFSFRAAPAVFSDDMKTVLTEGKFPYFSGLIAQILMARYLSFQLACGVVALLHLLAEWLYLGKAPRKIWVGLVIGLVALNLAGAYALQPRLKELHRTKYTAVRVEDRQAASKSFGAWHGVAQMINLLAIGGLAAYLWRVTTPTDPARFVSTAKFRG